MQATKQTQGKKKKNQVQEYGQGYSGITSNNSTHIC